MKGESTHRPAKRKPIFIPNYAAEPRLGGLTAARPGKWPDDEPDVIPWDRIAYSGQQFATVLDKDGRRRGHRECGILVLPSKPLQQLARRAQMRYLRRQVADGTLHMQAEYKAKRAEAIYMIFNTLFLLAFGIVGAVATYPIAFNPGFAVPADLLLFSRVLYVVTLVGGVIVSFVLAVSVWKQAARPDETLRIDATGFELNRKGALPIRGEWKDVETFDLNAPGINIRSRNGLSISFRGGNSPFGSGLIALREHYGLKQNRKRNVWKAVRMCFYSAVGLGLGIGLLAAIGRLGKAVEPLSAGAVAFAMMGAVYYLILYGTIRFDKWRYMRHRRQSRQQAAAARASGC